MASSSFLDQLGSMAIKTQCSLKTKEIPSFQVAVRITAMSIAYKMPVTLKPERELSEFVVNKNGPAASSMVQAKGHRIAVVLDAYLNPI